MADGPTLTESREKPRNRLSSLGAPRKDAIPAARRHSARVARLRRAIVWSVGGVAAVVLILVGYKSLSLLPVDLRFAHIGLSGTRITIQTPRIVGYGQDGRPYELRADLGVQDMATPDVFELDGLKVKIESGVETPVLLASGKAVYNSKNDHADLTSGVRIYDDKSFELTMTRAQMDFHAGRLTSDDKAMLKLDKITITSDLAEFSQPERRASFSGHVRTVIPGDELRVGRSAGDERQTELTKGEVE